MLSYLCESRPWVQKLIVIAHNAKAFDLHFILNSYSSEMSSRADYERSEIYVHGSGAFSVPGQCFFPTVPLT